MNAFRASQQALLSKLIKSNVMHLVVQKSGIQICKLHFCERSSAAASFNQVSVGSNLHTVRMFGFGVQDDTVADCLHAHGPTWEPEGKH
jgi:hypothetical protein